MAMRYPGGLIATSPVNAAYPSGVWTQSQTIPYASQNVWQQDQYWRNTTLLLHGDGTNGAQNNTFLDSSSNNFTITRNGNTTQGAFTPFQQNGYWSNYFDRNGDYITAAASSDWSFTGDFTIECWIFPTDLTSTQRIISHGGTSGPDSWLLQLDGTSLNFFYAAYPSFFTATSALTANQWQHIAIVRSGSTITIYVNGVSKATATVSATVGSGSYGISIGSNTYLTYPDYYSGYISNLRVVKGTAVYTSTFTPPTGPLTAITNTVLLTCQANRFVDANTQVSAKTLTPAGNTAVQAFQPFPGPTTWSASVLGGSGYFDGTGDNLAISSGVSNQFDPGSAFTFECWVYFASGNNNQCFQIRGSSNDWNGSTGILYEMYSNDSGTSRWQFNGNGTALSISGTAPPNGTWAHLAVGYNGTTTRFWINGQSVGTSTSSYTKPTYSNVAIGSNVSNNVPLNGFMSSLRFVKGTDVYGVSNTSITVPTAPLTAVSGTSLLTNFTNAGIFDNAQMNNLETVGNAQISTSVVKYGTGSMAFDGSGDWLAGPPTPQTDLGSGDFTLEAWLYRTASGAASDSGIVSRGAPSTLNGFVFGYTSGNVLVFNFNYSGSIVTGVTVIPASTWTHVAVSRNGNTFRLFVNGVLDATATSTNSQTTNASDIFYVGRSGYDSGRIVTGYLDDVRITKGVARYISNFTPPIARMPNQ